MLFGKKLDLLNYEVAKPDRTILSVSANQGDEIAQIVWDVDNHCYSLVGIKKINLDQLRELVTAIEKLNKSSSLPEWLKWK